MAVATVAIFSMRSPWYCPYCEQTSRRRANMAAHVDNKHPGRPNPLHELKRPNPFHAHTSRQPKAMPPKSFSTSSEPPKSSGLEIRFPDLEAVIQQVRQMNRMEINKLMMEIIKRINDPRF
jgi:hypothetical protein